jgi:hypothetical protein
VPGLKLCVPGLWLVVIKFFAHVWRFPGHVDVDLQPGSTVAESAPNKPASQTDTDSTPIAESETV